MPTDFLSQDDIDALLGVAGSTTSSTKTEIDNGEILTNIINDYDGHVKSVFDTNLGREVTVEIEYVDTITASGIAEKIGTEYLIAEVPYSGGCEGSMRVLAAKSSFGSIVDFMLGGNGSGAYSDDCKDAVSELFSQISGAFSTDLGGKIGKSVSAGAPAILDNSGSEAFEGDYTGFCKVTISGIEPLTMLISPDETLLDNLFTTFGGKKEEPAPVYPVSSGESADTSNRPGAMPLENAFSSKAPKINVDMLLDIELEVAIELGRANVSIKRVLDLAPGALVELDKFAGEPIDLLVNSKVVAKGEVVVIDENFGVRIISLVSPEERIRSLK
ncbi:MAG: flagellar motor switch protein FliN [Chitinivibrionia bacterium]|nr:flagellar motor switch protein FliN [Chitinivibrionia bacterium]